MEMQTQTQTNIPIQNINPIPILPNPNPNTLARFVQYLKLKNLSKSTIKQYIMYYNLFNHNNLTQDEVNEFILKYHKHSVVRAFVNNYLAFLKRKDIEVPRITGRKKRRYPPSIDERSMEIMRYALYELNEKYGLMFDLTLEGGLRRDELIKLTPASFEWNEWGLNMTKPCRLHLIGKGDKERIVLISSKLTHELKDFLKKKLANLEITMESYIWGCKDKRWWQLLNEVSKKLLGRRINPHLLRHHRATELYDSGNFDLIDLQNFLGHASVATTELYIHPDKEKILKKFEDFIMQENKQ